MPLDPPRPPAPLDPFCQPALPFPGLEVPGSFYWVLRSPAPLAGMILPPRGTPWERLHDLGFRHVVCLCSDHPVYDPAPLEWIVAVELCDLAEAPLPEDPDTEESHIRLISRAVLAKLVAGEGVVVHCAGGRGRTGTVLGCVLRDLGHASISLSLAGCSDDSRFSLDQIMVNCGGGSDGRNFSRTSPTPPLNMPKD